MTATWYLWFWNNFDIWRSWWFWKTLPTRDVSLEAGPEEPCVRPNPQVRHRPQDAASPRRARHFPFYLTFVLSFELSGKVCKCWKSIMVRAKIPPVLDTSAPCFYLCSPNRKYLQGLSFMAVYDKGTCQKLLSGFCPLRGGEGKPRLSAKLFWAQWLSVKGGRGTPQFR